MHDCEDKIRARAYEIWEREGRSGHADAHWLAAEEEVHAALTSALDVDVALSVPVKSKAQRRSKVTAPEAAPEAAPKRKTKARTPAA